MRAVLFAASFFACVILMHGRALALMEYCGAQIEATPVNAESGPASVYAFVLSAHSARAVTGHLSIHTSDGSWYGADLPETGLVAYTQRFQNAAVEFARVTYESAPIYIQFASAVKVTSAYFDSITVLDELVMGWDSNAHNCPGREAGLDDWWLRLRPNTLKLLNPKPTPTISPGAKMIDARKIAVPERTDCAVPFAEVGIPKPIAPDIPFKYQNFTGAYNRKFARQYQTIIEVAVNASGGIDDMWVFAPSGNPAFDEEAMKSARASRYSAGRAFCRDVPGILVYRAEFNPD